ncbi:MAG: hypothetical protein Q4G40_01770 [Brachybacterium sp.]|nr:hypothetical protein [Brachybacterium sp.]
MSASPPRGAPQVTAPRPTGPRVPGTPTPVVRTRDQGRLARFVAGYGRLTVLLIPIGVAMNFIGGQIAQLLKLPLYLDSIGTILVGALCGGLPGALVGLLSNIINSITAPLLLPYALLNILFGLLAGLLSRWGVFRSLWKTILAAIPYALIGGGLGGLITIWLFGGLAGGGVAIVVAATHALGVPLNTAVFLSSLPLDFLDKVISVLVVFVILQRVPIRLYAKLPLGWVYMSRRRRRDTLDVPLDDLALEL